MPPMVCGKLGISQYANFADRGVNSTWGHEPLFKIPTHMDNTACSVIGMLLLKFKKMTHMS